MALLSLSVGAAALGSGCRSSAPRHGHNALENGDAGAGPGGRLSILAGTRVDAAPGPATTDQPSAIAPAIPLGTPPEAGTMPTGGTAGARASEEGELALASPEMPLPVDDKEPDPASSTVTIKVVVEPPQRAHVWWGAKDLGLAPLEIQRPRGSGPVDLIVRAPGFLTVHTRAFTDRNDRIGLHLVPETDASRMLGYRPP